MNLAMIRWKQENKMTQISASMVKELREKTGAGMMDCKSALMNAGDMEGAVKILREKGLARAAKKTSRVAAEGLIAINIYGQQASMVELNCETDFVARNDDFKNLLELLAKTVHSSGVNRTEIDGTELNHIKTPSGQSVESLITDKVATIGEKIALRRFALLSGGDLYGSYLHGAGSIGALVEYKLSTPVSAEHEQIARDVAMHVAAASPAFIRESDIPESWVSSEREIFRAQVIASGKPENMVDKIIEGKMAKHKKDFCLLEQPFVKNPDHTVSQVLPKGMSVSRMVRFKVGEGIEKQEDNFAEEVKKMTA